MGEQMGENRYIREYSAPQICVQVELPLCSNVNLCLYEVVPQNNLKTISIGKLKLSKYNNTFTGTFDLKEVLNNVKYPRGVGIILFIESLIKRNPNSGIEKPYYCEILKLTTIEVFSKNEMDKIQLIENPIKDLFMIPTLNEKLDYIIQRYVLNANYCERFLMIPKLVLPFEALVDGIVSIFTSIVGKDKKLDCDDILLHPFDHIHPFFGKSMGCIKSVQRMESNNQELGEHIKSMLEIIHSGDKEKIKESLVILNQTVLKIVAGVPNKIDSSDKCSVNVVVDCSRRRKKDRYIIPNQVKYNKLFTYIENDFNNPSFFHYNVLFPQTKLGTVEWDMKKMEMSYSSIKENEYPQCPCCFYVYICRKLLKDYLNYNGDFDHLDFDVIEKEDLDLTVLEKFKNKVDCCGFGLLTHFTVRGHTRIVKEILSQLDPPSVKNKDHFGKTSLDWGKMYFQFEVVNSVWYIT